MTSNNIKINYVELPFTDAEATEKFYGDVFGWKFTSWGPDYISFDGAGIDGGFNRQATASAQDVGALIVLFAEDLEATLAAVTAAGATISRPIFSFPGGRRFHFRDPNGNDLAVWSHPA